MKKAGIITLYGLVNYGNRLQNYAVQKVLSDIGIEAKTYAKDICRFGRFGIKYRLRKFIHEITGYRLTSSPLNWAKSNRKMNFEDFTKKYLPTETVGNIDEFNKKADYFVIGSDQVWNPLWYDEDRLDKYVYLLTFANPEQKVCFSPSFGISELPDEWKPWFYENLRAFPSLNVREKSGADIIKKLTGLDAQVMIDPTMMIDGSDWLKVSKKPYGVNTKDPFLLTYFLGNRTEEADKDIEEILKIKKLNVFHLLDTSQPNIYACGPSEFIYMFSKADIILTDSFHACVFSFLFGKPFVVYDRDEEGQCCMNSRLDSLLSMLNLERKYRNRNLHNDWFECDYSEGAEKLKNERKKMRDYLIESFHLNDGKSDIAD